jgi:hypothetical protein
MKISSDTYMLMQVKIICASGAITTKAAKNLADEICKTNNCEVVDVDHESVSNQLDRMNDNIHEMVRGVWAIK